jgi:hypothetical protein
MEALARLSEYRLLDRLIRGRVWIGLVAFALIGIVTLQLGLLKLNGDIGRALVREALVQRENAVLSIENSELTASDGVEARAARLGMEFVPQSALRFLTAGPGVDAAGVRGVLSAQAHSSVASGQAGSSSAAAAGSAESPVRAESSAGTESSSSSSATPASSSEGASAQATPPPGGESPGTASTAPSAASGESAPASATESVGAAPSVPSSSSGAGGAGTAVAAGGGTQASAAGE